MASILKKLKSIKFGKNKSGLSTKNTKFEKDKVNRTLNPERNWIFALAITLLLTIFVLMANIALFLRINRDEAFKVNESSVRLLERIDKEKLDRVLSEFERKDEKTTELLETKPIVNDPSL